MSNNTSLFTMQAIGKIVSPFIEKFGIPRQPRLAPAVISSIVLEKEFANPEVVAQLELSSHIWVIFIFSECLDKGWKHKVRPPRLGGNKKVGVFASRSPFRPNPIGISAVELIDIQKTADSITLQISGADLMNGTPVIDIKPYIPYSDKIDHASNALAQEITLLEQPIFFSANAQQRCEQHLLTYKQSLSSAIEQILRCDPRPAYQKEPEREYGITLYHYNIRWTISPERIDVIAIENS